MYLLIETSGRTGQVALADKSRVLVERRLDETRRHARDLAPAVRGLLEEIGASIRSVDAVLVSVGPGSYTGLRVGIMSAKAFAYATGCKLIGVETFAAIATQTPPAWPAVEIIADAQQERVYCQRFRQCEGSWRAETMLAIRPVADWIADIADDACVSGPATRLYEDRLRIEQLAPVEGREPSCYGLLTTGLQRLEGGESDDVMSLEPIYLRPSAAEQQWDRRDSNRPHNRSG